jgi:hypothetical protein
VLMPLVLACVVLGQRAGDHSQARYHAVGGL